MKIQIDLRPISTNAFWGVKGWQRFITPRGRAWREYIQYHLIKHKPTLDRYSVSLEFHLKGKREFDTSNGIKPIEDTLTGFLWEDDKQIDEINTKRFYHAPYDCIIIEYTKSGEPNCLPISYLKDES